MKTYSIVKSQNEGVNYVIMQHQYSCFEEGRSALPSVVLCECDSIEFAYKILESLQYMEEKPYGPCGSCGDFIDNVFEECPLCGNDPSA